MAYKGISLSLESKGITSLVTKEASEVRANNSFRKQSAKAESGSVH